MGFLFGNPWVCKQSIDVVGWSPSSGKRRSRGILCKKCYNEDTQGCCCWGDHTNYMYIYKVSQCRKVWFLKVPPYWTNTCLPAFVSLAVSFSSSSSGVLQFPTLHKSKTRLYVKLSQSSSRRDCSVRFAPRCKSNLNCWDQLYHMILYDLFGMVKKWLQRLLVSSN